MSILIKGIEMPKAGYIDVRIFPDGIASKAIGEKPYYKEFYVVEVKAPHGRLGDLDALMNEMDKQENALYEHGHEFSFSFKSGGDVCTAWYNVEMMVEDAPTIIPAEEG